MVDEERLDYISAFYLNVLNITLNSINVLMDCQLLHVNQDVLKRMDLKRQQRIQA